MTMPQGHAIDPGNSPRGGRFFWIRETFGNRVTESAVWGVLVGLVLGIPGMYVWIIVGGAFLSSLESLLAESFSADVNSRISREALMLHMPYAFMVSVMIAVTAVIVAVSVGRLRRVRWTSVLFFELIGHAVPSLLLYHFIFIASNR